MVNEVFFLLQAPIYYNEQCVHIKRYYYNVSNIEINNFAMLTICACTFRIIKDFCLIKWICVSISGKINICL